MQQQQIIPDGLPSLARGGHEPGSGLACVMEFVSVLAGEDFGDNPATVHPILRYIAIEINDRMPDEHRHLLLPSVCWFFGTNDELVGPELCEWLGFDREEGGEYDLDSMGTRISESLDEQFGVPSCDHGGHEGTEPCQEYLADAEGYARDLMEYLNGALDVADKVLAQAPRLITEEDKILVNQVLSS